MLSYSGAAAGVVGGARLARTEPASPPRLWPAWQIISLWWATTMRRQVGVAMGNTPLSLPCILGCVCVCASFFEGAGRGEGSWSAWGGGGGDRIPLGIMEEWVEECQEEAPGFLSRG